MKLFKDPEYFKKLVIILVPMVAVLSSLISSIHLVDMFSLGNHTWMSYVLAFAFELGSIAAFLVLSIQGKINKTMIWIVFIMLTAMQILGNVYFSYDYVYHALETDSQWLASFQEMISFFVGNDLPTMKITLALILGIPIPMTSLLLLKSLAEYLTNKEEADLEDEDIEETESIEEQLEEEIISEVTEVPQPVYDIVEIHTETKNEILDEDLYDNAIELSDNGTEDEYEFKEEPFSTLVEPDETIVDEIEQVSDDKKKV